MRSRRTACALPLLVSLTLLGAATPPAVRSLPEHTLLRRDEGVWNATIQIVPAPGASPEVSHGTETNVLGPGGLWLISDFKGQVMGEPFQGHGVLGYDPVKKKYVRIWVDSTQAFLWPSEGTYDPSTRTLTLWMESPDSSGQTVRFKTTTVWKDDNTRVYTMYAPASEAPESASMTITYKRRK